MRQLIAHGIVVAATLGGTQSAEATRSQQQPFWLQL